MAFKAKWLFGGPVKSMSCCTAGAFPQESPASPKPSRVSLIRRWSSDDQHRRGPQPEAPRRSSLYTQQKAERALMREHFREKYNLNKNAGDQQCLREAGGKVRLTRELRAIVQREEPEKAELSIVRLLSYKSLDPGQPSKGPTPTKKMEPLQPAPRCLIM